MFLAKAAAAEEEEEEKHEIVHKHLKSDAPLEVLENSDAYALIYEYQHFNLKTLLRFSLGLVSSYASKMILSYQLIEAIQFLHGDNMHHGNMRSENIFLKNSFLVSLSAL